MRGDEARAHGKRQSRGVDRATPASYGGVGAVARAVLARWCAGRLGRSGAVRLEHGGVGARWPAQGRGGATRQGHGGAWLATRGGARGGGAG